MVMCQPKNIVHINVARIKKGHLMVKATAYHQPIHPPPPSRVQRVKCYLLSELFDVHSYVRLVSSAVATTTYSQRILYRYGREEAAKSIASRVCVSAMRSQPFHAIANWLRMLRFMACSACFCPQHTHTRSTSQHTQIYFSISSE